MFHYSKIQPSKLTKEEAQEEIDYLVKQKRGRKMAFYVSDGSSQRYWELKNRINGKTDDIKWWKIWE